VKHAKPSRAWRPVRARRSGGGGVLQGVMTALAFNLCLLLLPLAGATALLIVDRDRLYAYEYSDAGARVVRQRVERLNGELIQLDFDRERQWDDLVAMELMAGDIAAARGFLLSAPGMLRSAGALRNIRNDAELELAALELLTPGTRARYEATVPLLSRRAASGAAQRRDPDGAVALGDQRDFELLARAMLADSDADTLQFVLTGLTLGLGGEMTPQMNKGAATLLAASRREDYPASIGAEIAALAERAAPLAAFRAAATESAGTGDAASFANASAAFRQVVDTNAANALKRTLSEVGEMSDAASLAGTAALLTHASSLAELPRLKLVAQAAGDRAAAAGKRLPRDGRLLAAARGELTMTRDLFTALVVAGVALAGLLAALGFVLFQIGRRIWLRMRDDDYAGELVDISSNNWSPL
jgi:hypothetical protein